MLYVVGKKSFEVRRGNKIITLLCAKNNTRQIWRVLKKSTRQRLSRVSAHGKARILPCVFFCRVFLLRHTAKWLFTMCPTKNTRQKPRHTTFYRWPVVIAWIYKDNRLDYMYGMPQSQTRHPTSMHHSAHIHSLSHEPEHMRWATNKRAQPEETRLAYSTPN